MNRLKKIVLSAVASIALSSNLQASSPLFDMLGNLYNGGIRDTGSESFAIIGFNPTAPNMLMTDIFIDEFWSKGGVTKQGSTTCKMTSGSTMGPLVNQRKILLMRIAGMKNSGIGTYQQARAMDKINKLTGNTEIAPGRCDSSPILYGFSNVRYQFESKRINFWANTEEGLAEENIDSTINASFSATDRFGGNIKANYSRAFIDKIELAVAYDMSTGGGGQNGFMVKYSAKLKGKDFVSEKPIIQNITLAIYQTGEKKEAIFKATNKTVDKQVLNEVFQEMQIFEDASAIDRFVKIASGNDPEFEEVLYRKLQK